jgi:hypothetical protein
MRPWALAAMLVLGAPARTAPAAAPRPAETSPTLCAMAVDPGLALIEVRFDQLRRMDSWSWCGGGENYPEITGRPHFRDAHTAVLPVRLRPRHTYSLSINCFSGQGFRAVTGEAAVPSRLLFTTTAAPGRFTVSDPLNAKSWAEFRRLFDTVYSHRDLTGIDWAALFREATPWMLDAPTADEFALRLSLLLGRAEDIHLCVIRADGTPIERRGTPPDRQIDGDFSVDDPVLRAALEEAGNQPAPMRKLQTSPSCITYSFPSMRSLPASRACARPPAASTSSNATTSARMNSFSKSLWMTPAHLGAFHPRRNVHARTSFSPAVRYVPSPSR